MCLTVSLNSAGYSSREEWRHDLLHSFRLPRTESWLVEEGGVYCGAGLKDEPASSAQPDITPARIKTAIVRRNPIASPSSAQTMPQVKLLAIVPEEVLQLKAVPIEESPLDPDVIANPKRPKTIHI